MAPQLTQFQRVLAAAVYLAALGVLAASLRTHTEIAHAHVTFWFYSGVLMIVLGRYIVEPYFTTPADAAVNGLALLVALQALPPADQGVLIGFRSLHIYALSVVVVAALAIALKESRTAFLQRLGRVGYSLVAVLGRSVVIFSFVYWASAYSFFTGPDELPIFVIAIALWVCIVFFDVVGYAIRGLARAIGAATNLVGNEIGVAIGCDNPLLYKVEVERGGMNSADPTYGTLVAIETKSSSGSIGMVVARKQLLGKLWLSVYILTDVDGDVLTMDLAGKKVLLDRHSIYARSNRVFLIDPQNDLSVERRDAVEANPLFSAKQRFVGYITKDSNINSVHFIILRDYDAKQRAMTEGTILKTAIYGEDTLYQVVDGATREEHLEGFDSHGYTVGTARKLGKYDGQAKELQVRKWMPKIYTPLFFGYDSDVTPARLAAIAAGSIGRLPDTDLEIPLKDPHAIVTHNTAILGILGIGKSCLSFELVKKVIEAGVKVVCVDITNQYNTPAGLQGYVGASAISVDLPDNVKQALKASKEAPGKVFEGNPVKSGNGRDYRDALRQDLASFVTSSATVKIYNPDLHAVSKGVAYKNTSLEDMTVAEKTRIIAEALFLHAKEAGESTTAKYLLVLEEAHSLVPERGSVANAGDEQAANGTAKVILQGRKYGLGSLVITQRTANVSKSILNQCNTVFAMRVFDDTGKVFLENYIGRDYANTLPTLEERHAVAIGRGLRLKQPVIVQLNEKALVANGGDGDQSGEPQTSDQSNNGG